MQSHTSAWAPASQSAITLLLRTSLGIQIARKDYQRVFMSSKSVRSMVVMDLGELTVVSQAVRCC